MVLTSLFMMVLSGLPPESNRMQPDHAPTPFDADQIRRACAEGRSMVFLVQQKGQPDIHQKTVFGTGSDQEAQFTEIRSTPEGELISQSPPSKASWEALQRHASFPTATTKIESVSFLNQLGNLECWLYTVDAGPEQTMKLWFAKELAGPPVRFEQQQSGEVVFQLTMIENKMP